MEEQTAITISKGLFPSLPSIDWSEVPIAVQPSSELEPAQDNYPKIVTKEDLEIAAKGLPADKASGPDHAPNEIIKLATRRHPEIFLTTFNACMEHGHFPNNCKQAKLTLL